MSSPFPRSARSLAVLSLAGAVACSIDSPGDDPPDDALFFPMGMALDPARVLAGGDTCAVDEDCGALEDGWGCRVGTCRQRSPLLYVAAANSDLRFNGGALQVFNLDGFFAALADTANIAAPGMSVDDDVPCRAVATRPQVSECLESTFAQTSYPAHVGNFATDLEPWFDPETGRKLLLMPVRGDPSVVWFELGKRADAGFVYCGQGTGFGEDAARCGDAFRLRNLRDDPSLERLSIEPYELTISPDPTRPLAYLAHTLSSSVTLIGLRGLRNASVGEQNPVIVDRSTIFAAPGVIAGGYAIAERPCDEEAAPALSVECEDGDSGLACTSCARPLLYGSFRFARALSEMVVFDLEEDELAADQSCVAPDELGTSGGLVCDPQISLVNQFSPGGLAGSSGGAVPRLGSVKFTGDGETMYVVQSSPAALLRVNTSIGPDGDVRREPTGSVEVCARPAELTLYEDGVNSYALVSCYSVGQVYIVDLNGFQVVSVTQVGTGPHRMTVDLAREAVFVGNTLDATISVIDMGDGRATRFSEIGRLGLQEPYSG